MISFSLLPPGENILRKSLLTLAPLALAGFVGTAFADDSSVTLYGTLDASVANIQHSYTFDPVMVSEANPLIVKATQSATGMFSGGLTPSKWGIKGQEDMGGGIKALFLLESAINIGTGALSNAAQALTHSGSTGPNVAADSAVIKSWSHSMPFSSARTPAGGSVEQASVVAPG